jgi:hypothetical protein
VKLASNGREYALRLLDDYRDALRHYHKDNPDLLRVVDNWPMTYNRGYYYISNLPGVRRKEIETRIQSLRNRIKEAPCSTPE